MPKPTQFYAYVRRVQFNTYCEWQDPSNELSEKEKMKKFLTEVGTPFVTTDFFMNKLSEKEKRDMMDSYVPIEKGQFVRVRLNCSEYANCLIPAIKNK